MKTPQEYIESLRKLKLEVYMFGKRIENVVDDPIIRPSMNAVAMTYALAMNPEYEEIMTATSHLTGKKINRFTHIHQNADDLVKKSKMGSLMGAGTGCCFQRCVGMDALNALSMTTYDIDAKHGTGVQRALPEIPRVCPGERPGVRRRHDRPQGRPVAAAPQAGRPGPFSAGGGGAEGRHRGTRRQGPPDRAP